MLIPSSAADLRPVRNDALSRARRQPPWLASFAIAIPPLFVSLGIGALMLAQHVGWSTVLWPVVDLTLSEAAALPDAGTIVERLWDGADPNQAGPVRYGVPTSEVVTLLPIEAAVVSRELTIVELLIQHGARLDAAELDRLVCIADRRKTPDIAAYLLAAAPAHSSRSSNPVDCTNVKLPW